MPHKNLGINKLLFFIRKGLYIASFSTTTFTCLCTACQKCLSNWPFYMYMHTIQNIKSSATSVIFPLRKNISIILLSFVHKQHCKAINCSHVHWFKVLGTAGPDWLLGQLLTSKRVEFLHLHTWTSTPVEALSFAWHPPLWWLGLLCTCCRSSWRLVIHTHSQFSALTGHWLAAPEKGLIKINPISLMDTCTCIASCFLSS